jgi:hypothetical protein
MATIPTHQARFQADQSHRHSYLREIHALEVL